MLHQPQKKPLLAKVMELEPLLRGCSSEILDTQ
jgi:hypothetical protein